jgi:hypothetical protein
MRFILLGTLLAGFAQAQGVCVLDPIVTETLRGKALFHYRGQYRVLSKGTVTVRHPRPIEQQVMTWEIGPDGDFHLKGLKPGKYILEVRSSSLISLAVGYEVSLSKTAKSPSGLLILLGADFTKPCGGGSVTVVPMEKFDHLVAEAKKL